MEPSQLSHVMGYISNKTKIPIDTLLARISVEGTCTMSDAQVYKYIQQTSKASAEKEEESDYYEKFYGSYKKMCRLNDLELKTPVYNVLDVGSSDCDMMKMCKYKFFAKRADGIHVNDQQPLLNGNVTKSLASIPTASYDFTLCNKSISSLIDSDI